MLGQMQSKGSKNQKSQDKNKVKKENGNPNMENAFGLQDYLKVIKILTNWPMYLEILGMLGR